MPHARLVPCDLLDPRPAAEAAAAPIDGAVNIPFSELPQRTHELPAKDQTIPVAGPPALAEQTAAWLRSNGRSAVLQSDFQFAVAPDAARIGCLWRPHPFLADVLPQLSPGAALDLACGSGRDAVYMASRGWHVTAVDVLPDALARARDLAARCAAAIEPIDWLEMDLEHPGNPPRFDRRFDLIACFRYLHRPLFACFASWLRPGGSVVCETFTTLHRARHGKPVRDEHVLQPGELPKLLSGLEIRHFSEDWRGTAHTARIWARRSVGPPWPT